MGLLHPSLTCSHHEVTDTLLFILNHSVHVPWQLDERYQIYDNIPHIWITVCLSPNFPSARTPINNPCPAIQFDWFCTWCLNSCHSLSFIPPCYHKPSCLRGLSAMFIVVWSDKVYHTMIVLMVSNAFTSVMAYWCLINYMLFSFTILANMRIFVIAVLFSLILVLLGVDLNLVFYYAKGNLNIVWFRFSLNM